MPAISARRCSIICSRGRQAAGLIFRLDDTDRERSTEEFARGIEEDLAWLGVDWAEKVRQSDRFDRYAEAVEKLKTSGRLYPAYETPEELELKRKRQLARGKPPVYDRAALQLTAEERAKLEAEGRKPHWRFLLEQRDVVWDDLVRGRQHVDAASLSDPVLVRDDGSYLYTLPSVVDDIDLGITHVIRGEDHVANTAPQIQLFEALGATPPAFGHHSLLVGADGQALSKRDRSLSIAALREEGIEALAVASYVGADRHLRPGRAACESRRACAGLSTSPSCRARRRGSIRTSCACSTRSSCTCFRSAPSRTGSPRWASAGGEAFWEAVRGNLAVLDDAKHLVARGRGAARARDRDRDLCRTAAACFRPSRGTRRPGRLGRRPSRRRPAPRARRCSRRSVLRSPAREHGPELKQLLPLIGRARAQARLEGKTA